MNADRVVSKALSEIDLKRYYDLVAMLLPEPVELVLSCNDVIASRVGPEDASMPLSTDALGAHAADWNQQAEPRRYRVGQHVYVVFAFKDHGGGLVGNLVARYPGSGDDSGPDAGPEAGPDADPDAMGVLAPLFACMQTEFRLADELMVMAEELTARYEELNLVYDTQDQASDFEETHSQLKALVGNCLDYLDVSFAALVLRDKNLTLYDVQAEMDAGEAVEALKTLKGQLYDWVAASKQVAVINEVHDRLGSVLCPEVPYRLIAAPVLSGTNDSSGVLLIARSYAQPSFSNNDKNLLDVMARKVSKIVQTSYDSLTGLMKRSGFDYQLSRALQSSKIAGISHAAFIVDVDRMQVINDTLGSDAGDMVLQSLARLIQDRLRSVDTVARLSGDEFGVLIQDCSIQVAEKIAGKIVDAVDNLQLTWQGKPLEVHISVGLTPIGVDTPEITSAIAAAEVACAYVKERGGGGVSIYRSGDEELVRRKSYMDLVGHIQETLRGDRFELFCQAIVPLQPEDRILHGEVLVRMRSEAGEIISPGMFLPAAERYHLMPAIDRWVVSRTIEMLEGSGILDLTPDVLISVNLSGQTLSDESFVPFVHDVLDRGAVPAEKLCFEITETTAIADIGQANQFIDSFKQRGVLFSLDDFGTGLSTFSYLKELPVDFLKIDGSFVKEICVDPIAETMVSAINEVGHTMKLKTVGEFVENEEIRTRLAEIGVDYGQGYGIAKPIPFDEFLAALAAQQALRNAG